MLNLRLPSKILSSVLFLILAGISLQAGCSPAVASPAVSSTAAVSPAATPAAGSSPVAAAAISSPALAVTANSNVYAVAFFYHDQQVAALTRDDLAGLKQVSVTAAGSPQNGPTLLSALQKAGINDFNELTAYGLTRGRIAEAQLNLKRAQIDDSVVLDLNNRGKCKLCGVNIPQDNWVIDITKVEVK